MVKLGITFVASDFKRVISAISKTQKAVKLRALNISYQLGADFVKLLSLNIINQTYASSYPGYDKKYKAWKEEHGGDMRFWILKKDLLTSLTVWKFGRGWKAGIPAGILDSGNKNYTGTGKPSYIGAYANVLEYGGVFEGQVHLPRPLFQPSLEDFRKKGAVERVKESVQIIKRSWT